MTVLIWDIWMDQLRCVAQVWILRRTVGYILARRANKTSRRRQHYYGALPAIAHALLPYVSSTVYIYVQERANAHISMYTSIWRIRAHKCDTSVSMFYALCNMDNNWICPVSGVLYPWIKSASDSSLFFLSHLSPNKLSYWKNIPDETMMSDK